jgi:hypothetical protein
MADRAHLLRDPVPAGRGSLVKAARASTRGEAADPYRDRQVALGNQAVQRLAAGMVQAKLEVNPADDDHERQAEAAAHLVMRAPDAQAVAATPPRIQRLPASEHASRGGDHQELDSEADRKRRLERERPKGERERKKKDEPAGAVQRLRSAPGVPSVTPALETQIDETRRAGAPLPADLRTFFEERFGHDLGHVRVHADPSAAGAARELSAHAFTTRSDIYFGAGRYQPGTTAGRLLLAHELVHTLQQDPGPTLPARPTLAAMQEPAANPHSTRAAGPRGGSVAAPAAAGPRARGVARQAAPAHAAPSADAAAPEAAGPDPALEVVALDGGPEFTVSPALAAYIKAAGYKGASVRVRLGKLAAGTITVREHHDQYQTVPGKSGEFQNLELNHPALQPIVAAGLKPVLAVKVFASKVTGYLSLVTKLQEHAQKTKFVEWLEKNTAAMGWLGLDRLHVPKPTNELKDGVLTLQLPEFHFRLGGYLDGTGTFGLENEKVSFDATAAVHLKGVVDAELDISRDKDGQLAAHADIPIAFRNFTGNLKGDYARGIVDVEGSVHLSGEKLSGGVTLLLTDPETARNVAIRQLPPEAIRSSAAAAAGKTAGGKGPKPGPRAVAGWGTVDFHITDWLTGTAQIVVDSEGNVTVIGKMTPPAEIELFKQRDYRQPLFKLEARAAYGIPVVGDVFVFASVGMDALAALGPGKIYGIAVDGTYSTDPRVLQSFRLSGTLNISAFAGLKMRAEGGAGIEIASHDIKAGVGLDATAGVKGYVEATPTLEYAEVDDPQAGKKGESRLKGHLELAAQPFFELSGDLFVALETPWWSPISDHRWTWPLGDLEYSLPGEFGVGADIDYLIGSGQLPDITFGKVDFSAEKFMSDLLDDHVPSKKGAAGDKKGEWRGVEPAPPTEPPVPVPAPEPKKPPKDHRPGPAGREKTGRTARDKAGEERGPKDVPGPETKDRWLAGMKALGDLSTASRELPLTRNQLDESLARIKGEFGFTSLRPEQQGLDWRIQAVMNPRSAAPERIKGADDFLKHIEDLLGPGATKKQVLRLAAIAKEHRGTLSYQSIEDFLEMSRQRKYGLDEALTMLARQADIASTRESEGAREFEAGGAVPKELMQEERLGGRRTPGGARQPRYTELGNAVHRWAEILSQNGLLQPPLPRGRLSREHPLLGKHWLGRTTARADRLDKATGTIYEIKPVGRYEEGLAQARFYCYHARIELGPTSNPNGAWIPEVVLYDPPAARRFLVGLGYLEP